MYENAQAAGAAGAGPDMGAASGAASGAADMGGNAGADDDVVDADFKEV